MKLSYLRSKLTGIARLQSRYADVAHDFNHTLRVLKVAETIARAENADLEIVIPAAVFHDAIISPKHNPRARSDSKRSANFATKILRSIKSYPIKKIKLVHKAIEECSFSKGVPPSFLESAILHDSDRLDTTGAIGVARVFATTGQLQLPFYSLTNPFCRGRNPNPKLYAIDFFYARSLKVGSTMNTDTGKLLAQKRTKYVKGFLKQLEFELNQINRKHL